MTEQEGYLFFNILVYTIPELKTPDSKSRIEQDKALVDKIVSIEDR